MKFDTLKKRICIASELDFIIVHQINIQPEMRNRFCRAAAVFTYASYPGICGFEKKAAVTQFEFIAALTKMLTMYFTSCNVSITVIVLQGHI